MTKIRVAIGQFYMEPLNAASTKILYFIMKVVHKVHKAPT